jgi:preprotein translocase subunit YajC
MWSQTILIADDPAPQQPGGGGGIGGFGPLPMILMIGVLFVVFLWMPMRRQKKQQEQLLSNIKRNDKVITSGGVIGVVVDVRDKKDDDINEFEVVLRVDDNSNSRMRVLKSSIVRVISTQPTGSETK